MAALSSAKKITFDAGEHGVYGVKAAATWYDGSLMCGEDADGFARPCAIGLTAPEFYGIAVGGGTNSGASGTKQVECIIDCKVRVSAITNLTGVADIGKTVYAINDNLSDLTDTVGTGGTLAVSVGKVVGYIVDAVGGNYFIVHCQAVGKRSV